VPNAVDCQKSRRCCIVVKYTLSSESEREGREYSLEYSSTPGVLRSTSEYFGVFGVLRSNKEFFRSTEEYSGVTPEYFGVLWSTEEYFGVRWSTCV
jgi:hypothetical protein